MADKENAAAGPRLTRIAKWKRVALGNLSNVVILWPSSRPIKPSKPTAAEEPVDSSSPASASASPTTADKPRGDPHLCGAYTSDIYTYLRSMEVEARRRPAAYYIEAVQVDVTTNMRAILVDWLVEVAEEYKLLADTLYLTISYLDRFLSANPLGRNKLQPLGVAAMLIAAKYEEISHPHGLSRWRATYSGSSSSRWQSYHQYAPEVEH